MVSLRPVRVFAALAAGGSAAHQAGMVGMTLDEARALDKQDALARHRAEFALPDDVIYLDGNSLGPLPVRTPAHLARVVQQEWGNGLIRSWHDAGWFAAGRRVGGKIARIIGAQPDEVVVADSTSINLFKLMVAAVRLRPGRSRIVLEAGDFPTDLHMAEAAVDALPGTELVTVQREHVMAALDADTALLMLCHVHYQSGARHDMRDVNAAARKAGALVLWDLSHSTGAVELDLAADGTQLAVGCGYKFLNGGPGAPAWLFVAADLHDAIRTPLPGWFGHTAPFDFAADYQPATGASRFQCGTTPILGVAALEAGVDQFLTVDRRALFAKSAALYDAFALAAAGACRGLQLITPADARARGSHIAFRHAHGREIMGELMAQGVIGDFRPPDVLRFGLTPLYLRFEDIVRAVTALAASCARHPD